MDGPNLIFIATLTCVIASGCGGSETSSENTPNQQDGIVASANTDALFPESTFPPIQFTATDRPQPKSAEEAIRSLDAIKKLYDWQNIPEALNRDLTMESAYQYAKAWKLLNDQIPCDVDWLKNLDSKNLAGVDSISVQTIENTRKQQLDWLENRLPKQLADSAKYTRDFIKGNVAPMMWNHINKAADVDMSDQTAVRNLLGRQELNENRANQIRLVDQSYASAILFDKIMGIESDWTSKREEFQTMVRRYQEKLESAATAILPPKDIGDSNLTKIAKEVLADKKYQLGTPKRIIVNAPKKSFGKDHYTIDFGERSIEKSPYRWEEFQVATIERDGDQYYLWYNTILKYSVGPHTVPTGKWVLGPRHKSAPIVEANFNK